MIWFSCANCGKTLSRVETSAGAFVFCDCGQGTVVPWESTVAPSLDVPLPNAGAELPLPVLPEAEIPPLAVPERVPVARRADAAEWDDEPDARRRDLPAARDPNACFNHQDRPGPEKCADCAESFCGDCLVKFKGIALCGPCKNFRLRQTNRLSTVSTKAVVGLILALCCAPAVMCLAPIGAGTFSAAVGILALLGQIGATLLGIMALRDTERNPRVSGRSLAITTVLTGGLAILLTVTFLLVGIR